MRSSRRVRMTIGFDRLEGRQLLTAVNGAGGTAVRDTNILPFSAVSHLLVTFPDRTRAIGTGTVIDPSHVLTSGSLVDQPGHGGYARSIEVIPGQNGASRPQGAVSASYERVSDASGGIPSIGLITLSRPLGSGAGAIGVEAPGDPSFKGADLTAIGYPSGSRMVSATVPIVSTTSDTLTFGGTLQSSASEQGGPLLRPDASTGLDLIDGVISGMGNGGGQAVRMTAGLEDFLQQSVAADAAGVPGGGAAPGVSRSRVAHAFPAGHLSATPQSGLSDYNSVVPGANVASFFPYTVAAGQEFDMEAAVINEGKAAANHGTIAYYATTSPDPSKVTQGYLLNTLHLPSIAPAGSTLADTTVKFPAEVPPGQYYLGWHIEGGRPGEAPSAFPNGIITGWQFTVVPPAPAAPKPAKA